VDDIFFRDQHTYREIREAAAKVGAASPMPRTRDQFLLADASNITRHQYAEAWIDIAARLGSPAYVLILPQHGTPSRTPRWLPKA
jgi:hypothetical protein